MKAKKIIIPCCLLIVILVAVIAGIILLLGYFGLIPSVSKMLKTDRPRDLGVSITEEARAYNLEVIGEGSKYTTEGKDTEIQYFGEIKRDITLTSEQLTTLANEVDWKYDPISNLQIRLGEDGTIEGSGLLQIDKIKDYIVKNGVSTEEVDKVIERFGLDGKTFPFYVQLSLSADENEITWEAQKLEVGRFNVPLDAIEPYKDSIDGLIKNRLEQIPNLYINKIEIKDGKVNFIGTTPEYQLVHK